VVPAAAHALVRPEVARARLPDVRVPALLLRRLLRRQREELAVGFNHVPRALGLEVAAAVFRPDHGDAAGRLVAHDRGGRPAVLALVAARLRLAPFGKGGLAVGGGDVVAGDLVAGFGVAFGVWAGAYESRGGAEEGAAASAMQNEHGSQQRASRSVHQVPRPRPQTHRLTPPRIGTAGARSLRGRRLKGTHSRTCC